MTPTFGLVVFDDRLTSETLAPTGATANDSAYTEEGPIPGHPVPDDAASRWRPQVRGAQSVDLTLRTTRGGYPGRADAAVAYRLATDSAATSWRGWSPPNCAVHWTTPTSGWGAAATWGLTAACVIPSTQVIIVTAVVNSSLAATTWSYNPRTGTWTELYDWDAGTKDGIHGPIGMAYDQETDRLLLWSGNGAAGSPDQVGYYSDDGGTTWSLYTRGGWNSSTSAWGDGLVHVAAVVGIDWLATVTDNTDGTGVSKQFASSDNGVTWQLVAGGSGLEGTQHIALRTATGFAVVYVTTTNTPACRILGNARASFDDASEIEIRATACTNVWATVAPDGTIYAYVNGTSGATTRDRVFMYVSVNGGSTWTEFTWGAANGNDATFPIWHACVAANAQVHLLGTADGHADTVGTFSLLTLGGWGNVESGAGDTGFVASGRERVGWGFYGGSASSALVEGGKLYVPWDLPQNSGWTRTTATGTQSLDSAIAPGLELTTAGGTGEIYGTIVSTAEADYACGWAQVVSADDNADLADISTALTGAFIAPRLGNATSYVYSPTIDIALDGIQIRDVTTIRATVSLDMELPTRIRWVLRKGGITAWYSQDLGTTWTRFANDVVVSNTFTVAAADQLVWGQSITNDAHVVWQAVAWADGADWLHGLDGVADIGETSADGVRGITFGRGVPGHGGQIPIPDATTSAQDAGWLTGTGGPTYVSEQVECPAAHTWPVEHIHPLEYAGPRREWRATGTTETRFVYDQGSGLQSWYGGAMALVALRASFRTATLEVDDGVGGWTVLGTLDKGWGSINYTLTGRTVMSRVGTAEIPRYLEEGELVGGYAICSTAGVSVARRIVRQSAGFWTTSAAVQQVRIELEGVDGTETAAGAGEIVAPSGVFVVYRTTALDAPRRRVRTVIAASQIVPEGAYSAGILGIGRVVGVGGEPDWTYTREIELSRTTRRGADGSLSVRETGPPRRITNYGWTEGVALVAMRLLADLPDFVAPALSAPIGTEEDAWSSPLRLVEHALRSGEYPCVVLPRLPAATGTITDQSLYLYGRLLSDRLGYGGLVGTEGVDEVLRVDSLAFEEVAGG